MQIRKTSKPIKKGIIFDMDGTLWDSSKGVAVSWNEIIDSKGYVNVHLTEDDIKSVMGKTMKDIADALFQFAGNKKYDLLEECCKNENAYLAKHGGVLYLELKETFKALINKDYKLYIVSNCQQGYIEAFLNHYDFWKYVEDIECYGNNGKNKGENISLIIERNNIDKALYIGDIQSDYEASVEAGIPFIHASYGFGEIDTVVPSISELAELPRTADIVLAIQL